MKALIILAVPIMWTLCGCTESAHEKAMDKQIADLQKSCNSLSNSLASVNDVLDSITNLTANGKLVRDTSGLTYVASMDIDPATGLPIEQPLVLFPAQERVTEVNDQSWRWAVWFAIGNPNDKSETGTAHIKFLNADGQVIGTTDEYDLAIPGSLTNFFVTNTVINLPEGKNVKSVQVDLRQ